MKSLCVYLTSVIIESLLLVYYVAYSVNNDIISVVMLVVVILNCLKIFYQWDTDKPEGYKESEIIKLIIMVKGISLVVIGLMIGVNYVIEVSTMIEAIRVIIVSFVLMKTDMNVKFYKQ